jgi:pimeloyl-ACP methyl ester carboxylesterase
VVPAELAIPLSMARDAQAAIAGIAARCESDAACARAFPDLETTVADLLDGLDPPERVEVRHPRSGDRVALELDREGVAQALRVLLYSPELVSLMPFVMTRAAAGDWNPLVAAVELFGAASGEAISLGLFLSIVCSEDVPSIGAEAVERETRGTFLGSVLVDEFQSACDAFVARPSPERVPGRIAAPLLALSGELDPVTPPRMAELALGRADRGRHVVVRGVAHGTLMRGCVPRIVRRFFEAPDEIGTLDTSCLGDEGPPFFVDFFGPPP